MVVSSVVGSASASLAPAGSVGGVVGGGGCGVRSSSMALGSVIGSGFGLVYGRGVWLGPLLALAGRSCMFATMRAVLSSWVYRSWMAWRWAAVGGVSGWGLGRWGRKGGGMLGGSSAIAA